MALAGATVSDPVGSPNKVAVITNRIKAISQKDLIRWLFNEDMGLKCLSAMFVFSPVRCNSNSRHTYYFISLIRISNLFDWWV